MSAAPGVRPELPPMPRRIRALPVDHRGYPVPWFVQWFDGDRPADAGTGRPDHRVSDRRKLLAAVRDRRCWVCGERLKGPTAAFPIGPMCVVNRNTSEPPAHRECAEWSLRGCPFLTRPHMDRREQGRPDGAVERAGMLRRNPGVIALWVTRSWRPYQVDDGRGVDVLFRIGEPVRVEWWREGRAATRDEVVAALESGLPLLRAAAEADGPAAVALLEEWDARARLLVPA